MDEMNYQMMAYGLPAAVALIADGIDTAVRANLYRKNNKIISEFRNELKKMPAGKNDYGFVIPMFKNPGDVDKCLETLIDKVGVDNSDIIAVDDFSDDNGEVKRIAEKYNVETREITREEKDLRKVRAQRKGTQRWLERDKDYVVCLDSDCFIDSGKDQLESAMDEMDLMGLDAMTAQVLPIMDKGSNLLERIQDIEYKQAMRAGRGSMYTLKKNHDEKPESLGELRDKYSVKRSSQICISGAFGIFKPSQLNEVLNEMKTKGGGEDVEITQRLLAKDKKIGYNNNLIVSTDVPNNLKEWGRQRDYWAQFTSSSHFFDAGYKRDILFKNKKLNLDTGGTALGVQALRDVYAHPVKLVSFPFLAMNPPLAAAFLAVYYGIDLYNSAKVKEKGEKKDPVAGAMLPFYRLGQLLGPTTVGYGKQFGRMFGRNKSSGQRGYDPTTKQGN
ncbi:MAG: glycosyltransferase [Nanobdellota archaeon]